MTAHSLKRQSARRATSPITLFRPSDVEATGPEMDTYPPQRHILRDLRLSLLRRPGHPDRVPMPIVPALQHRCGTVSLGALAVAVDLAAAGVAMRTIAPDWLATADLEIHSIERDPVALAVAEPTMLRAGKTTLVFDVLVSGYDSEARIDLDPGVPLAHATMTFVRIARPQATAGLEHPAEPSLPERVDFALPTSGLSRPFPEELGLRTTDAPRGELELPRSDFTTNSFGSLQGGVVATLAQIASEVAAHANHGRESIATDLCVHYLAQGRGPYQTRCKELRATNSQAVHRVEIEDIPTQTLMAVATTNS